MRVVQVVMGLGWTGGVQEYVSGLSRGLVDNGHEVVILAGGKPPPVGPAPHVLAEGLEIVWHPKRRILGRYVYPTGLWSSLRRHARWADVVHVHQPFFPGTWLACFTRARIAATFYLHPDHLSGRRTKLRRGLLWSLLRRLNLIVAVSETELDLIRSVGRPRRAGVVWPALAERPAVINDGGGRPLVLYVGRLSVAKGVELLLRSFSLLPDDFELAVVGGGPDEALVESVCGQVGLDARRVLRGGSLTDQEVDDLFEKATVFVSASTQESFGIAVLKAIAHQCRLVVSDIPSHREIVSTLGVGSAILFDPGSEPSDLAENIVSAVAAGRLERGKERQVPVWTDSAEHLVALYGTLPGLGNSGDADPD